MQYVNLFGTIQGEEKLETFAEKFFSALGVSDFEERESGNYADGRYFRGTNGLIIFTVALSDESSNRDLPYWVHATSNDGVPPSLDDYLDDLVRGNLIAQGFKFAKLIDFGKRTEARIDY